MKIFWLVSRKIIGKELMNFLKQNWEATQRKTLFISHPKCISDAVRTKTKIFLKTLNLRILSHSTGNKVYGKNVCACVCVREIEVILSSLEEKYNKTNANMSEINSMCLY